MSCFAVTATQHADRQPLDSPVNLHPKRDQNKYADDNAKPKYRPIQENNRDELNESQISNTYAGTIRGRCEWAWQNRGE